MGRYNAAFFSALALGPLLGGLLYDSMGLNAPFYLWALLGATSFFVVYFRVKEPEKVRLKMYMLPSRRKETLIAPGYLLTFLACSGVVLWAGVMGGFNFTMLPSFAAGLGFNAADVGIIYLVYGGSTAIFNIHFGRQADRETRKKLIFTGCLAGAVSFAILSLADTMILVTFLFACLGMGLGMASPAAAALIADITCVARRGEVYGIFNTARMAGVVMGPMIAGMTADLHGVNGAIYAFTTLAIVITFATLIVRESNETKCE